MLKADSAAKLKTDSAAKLKADSVAKMAAPKSAAPNEETGDHDKAIRPKFKIDEKTGAVTPIKRP